MTDASPDAPRPLRLGMVGGGEGAFIGAVHRIAARLDGAFQLVAGALASSPEKALRSARAIGLAPERSYRSFEEMAEAEAGRPDGIEAVSVVTPNHMHAAPSIAFLKRGVHVICDKPLTATMDDARALAKAVEESGLVFVLTHNYTGYPLVRHAREMVRQGRLGRILTVQAEYPQDWLARDAERRGSKQAEWRVDPKRSGAGGAIGDIGTHAINLAEFVTGLRLASVAADMDAFGGEGRTLDTNCHVLLRFEGGAKGMLWASQVAPGNENGLQLRVYGTEGGLEWRQDNPNFLWHTPAGEEKRLVTRGGVSAGPAAARVTRVPGGHPEGYLEAFATIYAEAARAIRAHQAGRAPEAEVVYPTIKDGLRGMAFIEACVRSSREDARWTEVGA